MRPPPVIRSHTDPPGFWWAVPFVGAIVLAAFPVGIALLVWSCLRTSADVTALRHAAVRASEVRWERQVEFSAGRVPVSLARFGLNLIAPLDAMAREALSIPRSAEVAVFHAPRGNNSENGAEVLREADSTMSARNWERIVGVIDDDTVVAIYVPQNAPDSDELRACLLVMSEDALVVGSASANAKPLLEMIKRHAPTEQLLAWKH